MKSIISLITLLFIAGKLFCQCGEGVFITLQTQTEVDNFIEEYCSSFEGHLTISDDNNGLDDITSLAPLSSLSTVIGAFSISNNHQLTTLSGLETLNHVGSLQIMSNSSLIDIEGLSSLSSTVGDIFISGNEILENINGLSGLTNTLSYGAYIHIIGNTMLSNLSGLNSLSSMVSGIRIFNNENLINIDGLQNITIVFGTEIGFIEDITIYNNPLLSSCAIESICNLLQIDDSTSIIHDNGVSCNSIDEVLDACATSSNSGEVKPELKIYPNPVSTILHIVSPKKIWATIYNSLGRIIKRLEIVEGRNEINVSDLSSGIYFIQDEFGFTQKIIKFNN